MLPRDVSLICANGSAIRPTEDMHLMQSRLRHEHHFPITGPQQQSGLRLCPQSLAGCRNMLGLLPGFAFQFKQFLSSLSQAGPTAKFSRHCARMQLSFQTSLQFVHAANFILWLSIPLASLPLPPVRRHHCSLHSGPTVLRLVGWLGGGWLVGWLRPGSLAGCWLLADWLTG